MVYHLHEDRPAEGNPPAILMLHGFSGSSRSFAHLVPRLAERFRVIRADLAGHGLTRCIHPEPAERFQTSNQLADLSHIINVLNLKNWTLYGYSMGARLAFQYVLQEPLPDNLPERVVIESGTPGIKDDEKRAERQQSDSGLAKSIIRDFSGFIKTWDEKDVFKTPAQIPDDLRENQLQIRKSQDPEMLAASLLGFGTGTMPEMFSRLPELTVPLTALTGASDRKFSEIAAGMAQASKMVSHEIVDGCGHRVHLENPERLLDVLLRGA